MREFCPECGGYTVAYDGNRGIHRCFTYFCGYEKPSVNIEDIVKKFYSGNYDNMTVEQFKKEVGII